MSIRLGTSITRSRRAYDRRLRGVGAASDATKTDPSSGGLAGGKKTRTPPVAGTHGGEAGRRANAQRIRPAGYISNLAQNPEVCGAATAGRSSERTRGIAYRQGRDGLRGIVN